VIFPTLHLSNNLKEKKRNINIDLAILPNHDKKGIAMPQNKFKALSSRVMQCRVEERIVRNMRTAVVECFKCEEKRHKCREYPLWRKKEKKVERVAHPIQGKAH